MTTIEMLDDDPDPWGLASKAGCPCGTSEYDGRDRIAHAKWHLDWANGVRYPESLSYADDNLAVVRGTSPLSERRVAYQLALLMRREEGYDVPLLPDPVWWKGYPRWPSAYLALWRSRVIALVIIGKATQWGLNRPDAKGYIHFDQAEDCRAISGIFVCASYRRRGVGRRLIEAASKRERVKPDELAWLIPLSRGGKALAQSVAGDSLRLCSFNGWS
jgi:GNAT superfamily N-acetyltransferase